jgi:hypothetical protein
MRTRVMSPSAFFEARSFAHRPTCSYLNRGRDDLLPLPHEPIRLAHGSLGVAVGGAEVGRRER